MVVLLDCCHPADVHFFQAVARCLEKDGQDCCFTARPKDVVLPLLEGFGIEHTIVGTHHSGRLGKVLGLASRSLALARMAKRMGVKVLVGFCNPYVAQAARLRWLPSLVLTDTDTGHAQNRFLHPATVLLTPEWFGPLIRSHPCHLAGPWFKELAYLRDFTPDERYLKDFIKPYIIVRTVGWTATHDHGYRRQLDLRTLEERMGPSYNLYHSHEGSGGKHEGSKILDLPLPYHQLHQALAGASQVISEGATMACEAVFLGRPTFYLNPLQPGYLKELERANLLSMANNTEQAVELALSHIDPDTQNQRNLGKAAREYASSCWAVERYTSDLLMALIEDGRQGVQEAHQQYSIPASG